MTLAYEAIGDGTPLLALHGAYSTSAEVESFLEPMIARRPVRRIYVDLPGHGRSRPSGGVRTPDDALRAIEDVLMREAPEGPVLLLGHSYGAHFARALAARHPERVGGLALLCAVMPGEQDAADAHVVRDDDVSRGLDDDLRGEYESYFVVRTPETLERFLAGVAPSLQPVDDDVLETAIVADDVEGDDAVTAPVLVVSGRHDSVVGWRRQQELAGTYRHATGVVVADTGHALPHERPALLAALIRDWLDRAGVVA